MSSPHASQLCRTLTPKASRAAAFIRNGTHSPATERANPPSVSSPCTSAMCSMYRAPYTYGRCPPGQTGESPDTCWTVPNSPSRAAARMTISCQVPFTRPAPVSSDSK